MTEVEPPSADELGGATRQAKAPTHAASTSTAPCVIRSFPNCPNATILSVKCAAAGLGARLLVDRTAIL
jgi:hypothetical protein